MVEGVGHGSHQKSLLGLHVPNNGGAVCRVEVLKPVGHVKGLEESVETSHRAGEALQKGEGSYYSRKCL